MASELWSVTIADIASPERNALVGGPFGSDLVSKDYTVAGVPVIRGQNMGAGRWVKGPFVYVSEEKAHCLSANKARPGDLVFTQRGTLGQVAIVPQGAIQEYIVSQSQMKLSVNRETADVTFLYYLFQSREQQEYIRNNSVQTGVPHTNLTILRNTPLALPPIATQREVAGLLGSLDTRIEQLDSACVTMEAIAQAIFKSWFVDFDPVRAKAEGREPEGMDAATAALFPEKFIEVDAGVVPSGWAYGRAGEIFEQSRQSVNPAHHKDELFEHFSLPSFDEGKRPKTEYGRDIKSNKTLLPQGCVLLSKLNPHIPRIWLPDLIIDRRSIASTEFLALLPKRTFSAEYLFCQFTESKFAQEYGGLTTGTSNSHQRVKVDYLMDHILLMPDEKVVAAFTVLARPLFERIKACIQMQATLSQLRDTLLPRLISGKLRIPEAEKMVEAVL